jgi:carboxyl-terminal processing protease
MVRRTFLLLATLAYAGPAPSGRAEGPAKPDEAAAAAHYLWGVMDVVLDHHIDPPARQQMCLGAVRGLLEAAGTPAPRELGRAASAVSTEEQFAALLQRHWPKGGAPRGVDGAMLHGLLRDVAGLPIVVKPDMLPVARQQAQGELYVGTGIQVAFDQGEQLVKIVNPFRRGPARLAGAKPNDLIVEVDGVSMAGKDLQTVVKTIRGPRGSSVRFTVRQPGATETRTLKMVREIVPFDTVFGFRRISEEKWGYRVEPGSAVGYVWVNNLAGSTVHELRQLERRLRDEGVRALVLDLRFCSPAPLHQTEQVADCLLDGGVLWKLRDAHGQVRETTAGPDCVFRDWPLAVLINARTGRSGPSMLAAALRDNNRAVLIGEPLRDHNYVLAMIPLPEGRGSVRLPVGRIERAAAVAPPPEAEGDDEADAPGGWYVRPDHTVAMAEAEALAVAKWQRDKELPELPPGATDAPPTDPQLARAVEVLKAALRKQPAPAGGR